MMTMIDALSVAAGLLGLGAFGAGAEAASFPPEEWSEERITQDMMPPVPEPLAAGDPCYEAVAEALEKAGYLHS